MKIVTVERKPFEAQAVLVTNSNMGEVAKWCEGRIQKTHPRNGSKPRRFIRLEVVGVSADRLKKAFVGDWVVFSGTSFRVYLDEPFKNNFMMIGEAQHFDVNETDLKMHNGLVVRSTRAPAEERDDQ